MRGLEHFHHKNYLNNRFTKKNCLTHCLHYGHRGLDKHFSTQKLNPGVQNVKLGNFVGLPPENIIKYQSSSTYSCKFKKKIDLLVFKIPMPATFLCYGTLSGRYFASLYLEISFQWSDFVHLRTLPLI